MFCVGGKYVVEVVNDVFWVFDKSGMLFIGIIALNAFYGYKFVINCIMGVRGSELTDPVCYYDVDIGWFFFVIFMLE